MSLFTHRLSSMETEAGAEAEVMMLASLVSMVWSACFLIQLNTAGPQVGTTPSGQGTSVNQENATQACLQANLAGTFSWLAFPLPRWLQIMSSWPLPHHQKKKNLANTLPQYIKWRMKTPSLNLKPPYECTQTCMWTHTCEQTYTHAHYASQNYKSPSSAAYIDIAWLRKWWGSNWPGVNLKCGSKSQWSLEWFSSGAALNTRRSIHIREPTPAPSTLSYTCPLLIGNVRFRCSISFCLRTWNYAIRHKMGL